MWLLSQEGGVMPTMTIDWNKMCIVSWNEGGMCLRTSPETPSGPAAL